MAKLDATIRHGIVDFDESRFFRHLRKTASAEFRRFLRSIDSRACVEMASYVIAYLRRADEKEMLLERKRRGARLKKALTDVVVALRKAAKKYYQLGEIDIPNAGPLRRPGSELCPVGTQFFAGTLEAEADRLSLLRDTCSRLYSKKRFGVSGNHVWLVILEEFALLWTKQQMGAPHRLRADDIADLITAGKLTLGSTEDDSETDEELIRKAIRNFRGNESNARLIHKQISPCVQKRCRLVSRGPFLLGIKI